MPLHESLTNFSIRRFSGYICLKPQVGDDDSKVYNLSAINTVWKKWAMARITQKKPHVGITNTEESLSSIGSAKHEFSQDPVVKVNGELNSSHQDLSDEEVIETLKSLFCTLAKALKQTKTKFKFYGYTDKFLCQYNISHSKKSLPESKEEFQSQPSTKKPESEQGTKKVQTQSSTPKLQHRENLQELNAEPGPTPRQQGPKEVGVDGPQDSVDDRTEVEC
ncbi:expressed unknown protein [Seminavis robusta]|uniref:Uncharacterized protein n=1 Tax=Seminavis robusta TaxID=568900 RepID=A0A9N8DDU9_9STRA|nr:expressed unknown protein [Seminavis robusta]|eukprot:Sro77_g042020.1 n/a (221) ;mRNA; r:53328-53990